MSIPNVLIIEDDASIRRGLADALRFGGYGVVECATGRDAAKLAIESDIDLVLLDVMLPHTDGFSILESLRDSQPTLPVIMVTARGAEDDRVRGLQLGADDYVVKPFSAKELLARVEAVLRRSPQRQMDCQSLRWSDRSIDFARLRMVCDDNGASCELTDREVNILRYLATHRGRAVDRDELLQHVWRLDPRGLKTRTVDMHIARLREKIEADPAEPQIIQTVRGKGYVLGDGVEVAEA